MLMDHFLIEQHEAHQEILLQLVNVQRHVKLVDHKLYLLADKLVGLNLTNLDFPQPQVPVAEDRPPIA
jgi:hypothetical protein